MKTKQENILISSIGIEIDITKPVIGKIEDTIIKNGMITIENGYYYFCQNSKQGNECKDKKDYNFSWVFNILQNGSFTDNVFLISNTDTDVKIEDLLPHLKSDPYHEFKNINNIITFKIQYHDYFCGGQFFYNVRVTPNYNEVHELEVKNIIKRKSLTEIILNQNQVEEIKFFEKLGFKRHLELVNNNTKNKIYKLVYINN